MADLKYYDIILRPVVTEKSMNSMAEKKYAVGQPEVIRWELSQLEAVFFCLEASC